MKPASLLLTLLMSWTCIESGTTPVSAGDSIVDQKVLNELREQATKAWQNMEDRFRSVDVTYRGVYRRGPPNQVKVTETTNFRLAYDSHRRVSLLRRHSDGTPDAITHDVANSRYDFNTFSPDSHSRSTLNILNLSTNVSDGYGREGGLPTWHHRLDLLAGCRVGPTRLSELLDSRQYSVLDTAETKAGDLRRIRFSVESHKSEQMGAIYRVSIDPDHRYRVTEWLIDYPPQRPFVSSCLVEYFDDDEIYTPRRVVFTTSGGPVSSEQESTYERPQPCLIPDAEFYLPHYGISEAVLETLNPNPWPRWLLILGGVSTILVGGWWFRRSNNSQLGDA